MQVSKRKTGTGVAHMHSHVENVTGVRVDGRESEDADGAIGCEWNGVDLEGVCATWHDEMGRINSPDLEKHVAIVFVLGNTSSK